MYMQHTFHTSIDIQPLTASSALVQSQPLGLPSLSDLFKMSHLILPEASTRELMDR